MESKIAVSEEFCKALEALPAPVMVMDKELHISYLNASCLKLLKARKEDVLGKRCADLIRTPACDTEKCLAKRCMREGKEFTGDSIAKLTWGEVPVRATGAVIKDPNGEIIGYVEHIMDISKEVEIAKEISRLTEESNKGNFSARADESKFSGNYASIVQAFNKTMDAVVDKIFWYEQILDAIPFPISVTDLNMNTTFINNASEKVLKRSRADMVGKHCSEWRGPICGTKECGIVKMREAGIPRTYTNRGGKHTQIDVAYIKNAKGEPIGHIEVLQDVTAQQRVALYQKKEVERVAHNLNLLAQGVLDLDVKVEEADEYTKETKENFQRINSSISQVKEALVRLTKDMRMLTDAAKEGALSTRADANRHEGEYRAIVQGVNDTLDAVIKPIEEAMRVAQAYAEGDMTARVSIETKGDLLRFSQSLDMIGESLTELLKEVNRSVDLVQSTAQDLASSAEEMNASTEQVSSAIQQISKGAQSQAAAVDETAKVMAEISTASEKVVSNASSASESAKRSSDSARRGRATVETTVKKMREVEKVVQESASVIEGLGRRSEEIGEIVDVITNISDQTNMLALNAAIEAARAGEQGRGFAVVAEEVKNLAEDSREAAERIAKMIKEVQAETAKAVESMKRGTRETSEGLQMVDATGKAFEEIAVLASKVDELLSGLMSMMMQQKEGTQRAAKAVDGIASIAEETASASEESASSTEQLTASMEDLTARAQTLAELASKLKEMSSRFNIGLEETESPGLSAQAKEGKQKNAFKTTQKAGGKGEKLKVPTKVKEALSKRGIVVES
ncbi:MAG: methyl-accepting chemotaxis protein [Methanomassiliicoccales archaeon]